MTADAQERAAERITSFAARGLDLVSFWHGCSEVLAVQVPHMAAPCWYTLDPSSLLITSHVQEGMAELPDAWLEQEYLDDDVHKLAEVVRAPAGISTLHEATGGHPSTSRRWHENMRYGGDQELIAALRLPNGAVWGAVGLYREPGAPTFSDREIRFLSRVSEDLARGARRALLYGHATDPDDAADPTVPGLVVLDGRGQVVSMTANTPRWFEELRFAGEDASRPPTSVRAVAASVLYTGGADGGSEPVTARVHAASGGWLTLDGARMDGGQGACAAVIIAPAQPSRIVSLLMATYDLTSREEEVARHVLQGTPTSGIARVLGISTHTVQEHLKGVFAKTGVRSRRELVATVFFSHYEPRVRNNEQRTARTRPILGDPVPRTESSVVGPVA